jgi:hypothetical protein
MQETKLNGIRRILNFISKYELGFVRDFYCQLFLSLPLSHNWFPSSWRLEEGRKTTYLIKTI